MAGNSGSIITPSGETKVGTNDWKNIAYGNGKYVIVGQDYNSGYITTSTDGVNWTTPTKSSYQWNKVVFGDGKFLAIENDYPTLNIASSTDGVNWNTPISLRLGMSFTDIIYAEGKFVAVGTRNSSDAYSTASVDGTTWTTPISFGFVTTMDCLAYGNGNFVAGLDKGASWFNSTNGVNWQKRGEMRYMKDVIYADNRFVCVGSQTEINYSVDGISWKSCDFFTNDKFDWFKILYNNNFFTVGKKKNDSSYYITASTDGIKWIKPVLLLDGAGNCIAKTINDMYIVH